MKKIIMKRNRTDQTKREQSRTDTNRTEQNGRKQNGKYTKQYIKLQTTTQCIIAERITTKYITTRVSVIIIVV